MMRKLLNRLRLAAFIVILTFSLIYFWLAINGREGNHTTFPWDSKAYPFWPVIAFDALAAIVCIVGLVQRYRHVKRQHGQKSRPSKRR